ncbi:MAG: hypothetical protein ACOC4G_14445 [Bacillota bacterium]
MRRYKKNGNFTKSQDVLNAKKEYQKNNDSVTYFTSENLERKNADEPRFVIPKKLCGTCRHGAERRRRKVSWQKTPQILGVIVMAQKNEQTYSLVVELLSDMILNSIESDDSGKSKEK